MQNISFTIDEKELQMIAKGSLSRAELLEVFTAVENDLVLWQEIENSISTAVDMVLVKRK